MLVKGATGHEIGKLWDNLNYSLSCGSAIKVQCWTFCDNKESFSDILMYNAKT